MATNIGNPLWVQAITYAAADDRTLLRFFANAAGVAHSTDLAVAQNGSPNMSVNVSSGQALVGRTGSSPADFYVVESPNTSTNLTIATADPTNPRIDLVVVTVNDAQYSGGTNSAVLQVITGTPAGSPVQPSTPNNSLLLATVAVAANATSIVNANITNQRVQWARAVGAVTPLVYTSSSTLTALQAAGATALRIRCVGSGGSGGGAQATSTGQCSFGSGGQGGHYAETVVSTTGLTFPFQINVGAAVSGTLAANGTNGNTSSVITNNGSGSTLCSAGGGQGGFVNAATSTFPTIVGGGGAAASSMVGAIQVAGEPGQSAITTAATSPMSGAGGTSVLGPGGAALNSFSAGGSAPLSGYGGGGSGAARLASQGSAAGGSSAAGVVIIDLIF